MRVVMAHEMKSIDDKAVNEFGMPGLLLMENAGRRVAEVVADHLSPVRGRTVTVFAGKGNNGGDGFAAARHLFNMGADVKVLVLGDPAAITGDPAVNLGIWQKMGQKVYPVNQREDLHAVRLFLVRTDIIVDAIYGTGFKGKIKDHPGRIIEAINASGKPVIAVDMPSGLEADTGSVGGSCCRAAVTVTFGLPKIGLLLEPGASFAGDIKVADISLPLVLLEDERLKYNLLDDDTVGEWINPRSSTSHKGDYGRVLVVAGSRGMAGAAVLAAKAAARAGAGLVTLLTPESIYNPVAAQLSEVMTYPAPCTDAGSLSLEAMPVIDRFLGRADVLALGPGLSMNDETVELVRRLVAVLPAPSVIDADALNALAGSTGLLKKTKVPVVITPHPGEMARLTGLTTSEVQQSRLALAEKWSVEWNSVLVLKGARTLVATPEGNVFINSTGNPGMASGGTGDVLTGIIAGLMAQGLEKARAAAAGVYLHGLAGDYAAREKSMTGLVAGDILEALPVVAGRLERTGI